MTTALITGASSGIGLAFAERLAAEHHNLILVARNRDRLERVAAVLSSSHGVNVDVLDIDLSHRDQVDLVGDRLSDSNNSVDFLVNNAGFGIRESFIGGNLDAEQQMIDVMVTATMRLSHAVLPGMVKRNSGAVINISSIAGWMTSGTYSAAKAWVTTFTEGLSHELAGTGVSATAVCPGLTHTEFHSRAEMDVSNAPDWLWLDVNEVVDRALHDSRRGRPISVAGRHYQAISLPIRYWRAAQRRAEGALRSRVMD